MDAVDTGFRETLLVQVVIGFLVNDPVFSPIFFMLFYIISFLWTVSFIGNALLAKAFFAMVRGLMKREIYLARRGIYLLLRQLKGFSL